MHFYTNFRPEDGIHASFGFGFGFEPVLSNLRNTPTQFFEYSYRRYLKGFGLSINSSNFGQCTVVRTDRIFRPILMVWYLHSNQTDTLGGLPKDLNFTNAARFVRLTSAPNLQVTSPQISISRILRDSCDKRLPQYCIVQLSQLHYWSLRASRPPNFSTLY